MPKAKTVSRAVIQTLASRQCSLLIRAVGLMVLARLLTPEDFGLFAIAMTIMAFSLAVVDFGLPSFLITTEKLTRDKVRSAVGLCLCLALGMVMVYAAALAWLPPGIWPDGMRTVLALLAAGLLFRPLVLPVEASLRRNLEFGLLSILTVVRILVQTAVACGLAAAGTGVVALAGGVLAEMAVAALVLIAMAGRGRLAVPAFGGWRLLSGFGVRLTAISLVKQLGDALIILSISRMLGLAALGLFNRAETVVRLFDRSLLDGIAPVVLPALSRSLRDGMPRAELYLKKTAHLTALCWPAFAAIGLLAEPLVAVLLGGQWQGAVPAVRILALSGLFLPFVKMSMKLFVALGMSREYLRLQVRQQIVKVLLVAAGAFISLEAACLGVVLGVGFKAVQVTWALKRATRYRSRDLARIVAQCAVITGCTVVGPGLLVVSATGLSDAALLAVALPSAALGWLLGAVVTQHPLLADMMRAFGPGGRRITAVATETDARPDVDR